MRAARIRKTIHIQFVKVPFAINSRPNQNAIIYQTKTETLFELNDQTLNRGCDDVILTLVST